MASVDDYLQYVELRGARTKILGQSTPAPLRCRDRGSEAAVPRQPPTLLIEIATITARGLAGQPMKCGAERARLAEADIKRNVGYGQLTIRQ